jgi:hypothetical protein
LEQKPPNSSSAVSAVLLWLQHARLKAELEQCLTFAACQKLLFLPNQSQQILMTKMLKAV